MLSRFSFDPSTGTRRDESESESESENEEPVIIQKQPIEQKQHKSTELCNHSNSCRRNAIKSFVTIFKWSLVIKLAIQYLSSMRKILGIRSTGDFSKVFLSWASNKDSLRFATVLALINSVYKATICYLRRILKNEKLAAPFAGFLSGLCLYLDVEWRRNLYAVLMISKMVDSLMTMITSKSTVIREQEWVSRDNIMFLMLTGCMGLG